MNTQANSHPKSELEIDSFKELFDSLSYRTLCMLVYRYQGPFRDREGIQITANYFEDFPKTPAEGWNHMRLNTLWQDAIDRVQAIHDPLRRGKAFTDFLETDVFHACRELAGLDMITAISNPAWV